MYEFLSLDPCLSLREAEKKAPQGNNLIVQEPQPGLTAGEEKGQLWTTFAVGGRVAWKA